MSEPILVVDPGTTWTTAAVVTDGRSELLKEPATGSYCWPTSVARDGDTLHVGTVAERRKHAEPALYAGHLTALLAFDRQVALGDRAYPARELASALLAVLKTEAERLVGRPITRILVLCEHHQGPLTPAGQEMIAAAASAGFTDAELLFLPGAVALAPADQAHQEPAEPDDARTPGELVLVCDAGASALRLTLVATCPGQPGQPRAAAAVAACGGDKLDALLTDAISRGRGTKWIRPLINAEGAAGVRARLDLAELARRIRHELTDADQAEDVLNPLTPMLRFTRQDLDKMMRQPLGQLSSACREVLGKAPGAAVQRVMLVGGCARMQAIQQAMSNALTRQVQPAPAPELTALRGGVAWAAAAARRRVPAVPVTVGLQGLAWQIPGDAARLTGYAVPVGTSYAAGATLVRVRAEDDTIWDLASDAPGTLEQHCASTDAIIATADVLTVARRTSVGPADRRSKPLRLAVLPGGQYVTFSQDGRQLATAEVGGTVLIWDAETATELNCVQVGGPVLRPGSLAATTSAEGHWLTAHVDGGAVVIRDIATGRQLGRVAKGGDARMVQFSGDGGRLSTVERKKARIWEATGRELMAVKERPVTNEAIAVSRDAQRLALVSRAGIEVWEHPGHKRLIVRRLPQFQGRVWRLAFSADGTKILFAFDSKLELVSLATGETLWSTGAEGPVVGADFAPDDHLLATISQLPGKSSASLRDAADGREISQLGQTEGEAGPVQFSPDGRFLITTEGDHAVLWALAY